MIVMVAAAPLRAQDTTLVVRELHGGDAPLAFVLDLPFRIAAFPLRVVGHGVSDGLKWVERAGLIHAVSGLIARMYPVAPRIGGLGEHSGPGAGLSVTVGARDSVGLGAMAAANATLPGYQLHDVALRYGLTSTLSARLGGTYEVHTQDEFFGIGMGAALRDRSDYRFRRLGAGAGFDWRPVGGLRIDARGDLFREVVEGGARNALLPDLELQFDARLPPGFDLTYRYVRPSVTVTWDGRRDTPRGRLGAWLTAEYAVNRGSRPGSATAELLFHELNGETRLYASLGGLRRTLALRARLEVRRDERGAIPFHRLAVLGGSRDHRAFRSGRFRDNDGLLLTAEYRYRIWEDERGLNGLEMVLFVDQGTVVADLFSGLGAADVVGGYGAGLRLAAPSTIGRLELARGREGIRLLLRAGAPF